MVSLKKMKMKSIRAPSFKRHGKNNKTDVAAGEATGELTPKTIPMRDGLMTKHYEDVNEAANARSSSFSSAEERSSPVPPSAPSPDEVEERAGAAPNPTGNETATTEVRAAIDDPPLSMVRKPSELGVSKSTDDETDATEVGGSSRDSVPAAKASEGEAGESTRVLALDEAEVVSPAYGLPFCGCFDVAWSPSGLRSS